jgi:hypothetical protein
MTESCVNPVKTHCHGNLTAAGHSQHHASMNDGDGVYLQNRCIGELQLQGMALIPTLSMSAKNLAPTRQNSSP